MNKLFLTILLFGCFSLYSNAQGKQATRAIDYQYTGEISQEDLINSPYTARWYNQRYKMYRPAPNAVQTIEKNISDYDIEVYMGTWCPDSHREIPRFFKILEQVDYDMDKLKMFTLDNRYQSQTKDEKGKNITAIPTIIFYKDGKEVNRFVEHARESIARDVAKIVSGKEYVNFHAK